MPAWSIVNNSPACEMPFWLRSRQTRTWFQRASRLFTLPSWLVSSCASAAKPSAALPPVVRGVASPNSSLPLSMLPLPLRSMTSKPSSGLTQPVLVLTPLPSWSNSTPDCVGPSVSRPSPSRSRVRGSRRTGAKRWAVLKVVLIRSEILLLTGSIRMESRNQSAKMPETLPSAKSPSASSPETIHFFCASRLVLDEFFSCS